MIQKRNKFNKKLLKIRLTKFWSKYFEELTVKSLNKIAVKTKFS